MRNVSSETINTLRMKLQDLKLIIIDEISMKFDVSSSNFNKINSRLKEIFCESNDFGDIPIIAFGDFNQLKPVGDNYIFEYDKNNQMSSLIKHTLCKNFKFFELTEIMRQKDDKAFTIALNNLANNKMTSNDVQLLQSRQIKKTLLSLQMQYICFMIIIKCQIIIAKSYY
jgi:hypothetical protein